MRAPIKLCKIDSFAIKPGRKLGRFQTCSVKHVVSKRESQVSRQKLFTRNQHKYLSNYIANLCKLY